MPSLAQVLPVAARSCPLERPAPTEWRKGDGCCQVTSLGVEGDGTRLFKLHRGRIHKREGRTCVVQFDNEDKPRRVASNRIYREPQGLNGDVLRVGGASERAPAGPPVAAPVASASPGLVRLRAARPKPGRPEGVKEEAMAKAKAKVVKQAAQTQQPQRAETSVMAADPVAAMESWLELGGDLLPALRKRQGELRRQVAEATAELSRVDEALRLLRPRDGAPSPEPEPKGPPLDIANDEPPPRLRRSPARVDHAKRVVLQVFKDHAGNEGLRASEVAALARRVDHTLDRYEVYTALKPLTEEGALLREGDARPYTYILTARERG